MTAGRPPLPTAVKAARGTLQPCRTNPDEPRIPPAIPTQPDGLDEAQAREWEAWSTILFDLGVLTAADGPALLELVDAGLRVRAAKAAVRKYGATETHPKTAHSIRTAHARELDAAMGIYHRWCVEFGVTPSARSKVRAVAPKPREETPRDVNRRRFFGT